MKLVSSTFILLVPLYKFSLILNYQNSNKMALVKDRTCKAYSQCEQPWLTAACRAEVAKFMNEWNVFFFLFFFNIATSHDSSFIYLLGFNVFTDTLYNSELGFVSFIRLFRNYLRMCRGGNIDRSATRKGWMNEMFILLSLYFLN